MLQPQDSRFWKVTLQTGLVDEARLRSCWEEIPSGKRTADAIDRRLARRVVESGLLTRWQVQQLFAGVRPQALFYNKYVIEDMIGQGGMGRVYRARDRALRRPVALKVLSRERMNNPRALARFRREAWVGAQLQHENLVRVYDAGEEGGQLFLVMEYIEGKTLGHLLAKRGPLPAPLAARITRQVALGLEHARLKGLVHRDVNPMNILLDRAGTAKLTDLGLAIDLGDDGDAVTRDGATVGTFDYISPEQARHSREIDIRSDIYSLGCSLYQMLTARVPFPQPSLPEKLYAHQMLEPVPIGSLVAGVPEGLDQIVRRMMAKRPGDRYATPAELAGALEPFQCGAVGLEEIESSPEVAILIDTGANASTAREVVPEVAPTVAAAEAPIAVGGQAVAPTVATLTPPSDPTELADSDALPFFPQVDTGPEPGLAETAAGPLWRSDSREVVPEPRRLVWLALPVALVLAAWLAWTFWPAEGPSSARGDDRSEQVQPSAPPGPDLAVRWGDGGGEQAVPSLKEGIRLAVGKDAVVVLRNAEPLVISRDESSIISGSLVLVAGDGTRPVIHVERGRSRPVLEVKLGGSLRLLGITVRLDTRGEGPLPSALIDSAGNLAIDRCAFEVAGDERPTVAIQAEGRATSVANSRFTGFDTPITVKAAASARVELANCLVTRDSPDGPPPARGWAIDVTRVSAGGATPPAVEVRRCTVVGLGLIALRGVSDGEPVRVAVVDSVVQGQALLLWGGGAPFPRGLSWTGQNNLYDLGAAGPWVVLHPEAGTAESGLPKDLATWREVVASEDGSEAREARFVGSVGGSSELSEPADWILAGTQGEDRGLRAPEVGP